jgi:hypothetical protein
MSTHSELRTLDAHSLLARFGVPYPSACLDNARNAPGESLRVLSSKPGTALWLTCDARHPSNGAVRFTVNVCTDHDDEYGCCDACGRWADAPGDPVAHAAMIAYDQD